MARRLKWQAIKRHRTYTYDEAARVLGVHKRTIMGWVRREGLTALTDQKPHLIRGEDLRTFLRQRQETRKRPLRSGEMFCLGCKAARRPDPALVEDHSGPAGPGHLVGLCPRCAGFMHLRIARSRITDFLKTPAET